MGPELLWTFHRRENSLFSKGFDPRTVQSIDSSDETDQLGPRPPDC